MDRLQSDEQLKTGESLVSANGRVRLVLQPDGNVVRSSSASPCSHRPAHPEPMSATAHTHLQRARRMAITPPRQDPVTGPGAHRRPQPAPDNLAGVRAATHQRSTGRLHGVSRRLGRRQHGLHRVQSLRQRRVRSTRFCHEFRRTTDHLKPGTNQMTAVRKRRQRARAPPDTLPLRHRTVVTDTIANLKIQTMEDQS